MTRVRKFAVLVASNARRMFIHAILKRGRHQDRRVSADGDLSDLMKIDRREIADGYAVEFRPPGLPLLHPIKLSKPKDEPWSIEIPMISVPLSISEATELRETISAAIREANKGCQ